MRAFVTGATGFLGTHLVRALDCPTVSLVRDFPAGNGNIPSDHVCFGDLSDLARLERILAEYRIDTVFHLAAQTEVATGAADPTGTWEANVRGTWNVLEACRRQKVARIIVASSDKAYGRAQPPYVETMQLLPDRPYETSKACVDMIAHTYAASFGMSVAVTRCVNLYGPECHTLSTLVPNTIRRLLRGERPIIRNGGTMRRDWLFIEDAVDAYLKLAQSDYVGPMNFGGNVGWTVRSVVDIISKLMGSRLDPIDEPDAHGEIVDQWADSSLAKKVLGWEPQYTLESGLRKTVDWYVKQDREEKQGFRIVTSKV